MLRLPLLLPPPPLLTINVRDWLVWGGPFNPKFRENNSSPQFVMGVIRSFGAYRIFVNFENYEGLLKFN